MKPSSASSGSIPPGTRLPSCFTTREGWARFFELRRLPEPHLHQIEPTNQCVYSCIMCPRPKHMRRPVGFMPMPVYEKVIDEVARYAEPVRSKEIELFHFGESLLHPEIDAMTGYASERGLKIVLSVNGPQLTPDLAMRILERRPHRLIISLDGDDAETYRKVRGAGADFNLAVRNIEALADAHQRMRSETRITVRMIELAINREQTASFRKRWEDRGVEAEIRRFFPWGERDMTALGEYERYPEEMPCPFPWQHLVVQWNGDVVPCCRDYNAAITLGNVNESSLKDIWNSERYEDFRRQMAGGEFRDNPICAACLALYHDGGRSRS